MNGATEGMVETVGNAIEPVGAENSEFGSGEQRAESPEAESGKQTADSSEAASGEQRTSDRAPGVVLPESVGEAQLPEVPEGVVQKLDAQRAYGRFEAKSDGGDPDLDAIAGVEGVESAGDGELAAAETLRWLGQDGPEVDYLQAEGEASHDDVMLSLVEACLEGTVTGQTVAQVFCRGDVDDPRVSLLLLLLAQDAPVTSALVLSACRAQGYGELVDQATIVREELRRAGDVGVEAVGSTLASFTAEAVQS